MSRRSARSEGSAVPPRPFGDRIWPRRHDRFWNLEVRDGRSRPKQTHELFAELHSPDPEVARATLAHVEAVAQSAVERAAAADRRATTLAGAVAIAASFTIGGGSLALDDGKVADADVRRWMTYVLLATTVLFVLSAIYALRALVVTRVWNWPNPHDLHQAKGELSERLSWRAAQVLDDFGRNWEISDLKNRCVDWAARFLGLALVGIAALAVLLVVAAP